jgi:hypothetical protein
MLKEAITETWMRIGMDCQERIDSLRFWSRRGTIWSQPQQVSAVKMLRPPNIV